MRADVVERPGLRLLGAAWGNSERELRRTRQGRARACEDVFARPTRFWVARFEGQTFKLGFGGPIGSGLQFWPWIGLDDVVGSIQFLIENDTISGPVNLVAPHETRCKEFTRTLGSVLRRPAFMPAPAFAVRAALGEMADALLLASQRVQPQALVDAGYQFREPELDGAIRTALGKR